MKAIGIYRSRIDGKLELRDRAQLVEYAIKVGLL